MEHPLQLSCSGPSTLLGIRAVSQTMVVPAFRDSTLIQIQVNPSLRPFWTSFLFQKTKENPDPPPLPTLASEGAWSTPSPFLPAAHSALPSTGRLSG